MAWTNFGTTANNGFLLEEDLAPATKLYCFAVREVSKTPMRSKLVVCHTF